MLTELLQYLSNIKVSDEQVDFLMSFVDKCIEKSTEYRKSRDQYKLQLMEDVTAKLHEINIHEVHTRAEIIQLFLQRR
jgi:non-homologous end joining protein Ku